MIRVLSVIHHNEFSGPANRNSRVAPFLSGYDVETTILLPDFPGSAKARLDSANVKVETIRLHRLRATTDAGEHIRFLSNFWPDVQRIRKVVRKYDIDVVQLNGFMNPHGAIAAKLESKKLIWQLIDTRSPRLLAYLIMPALVILADRIMSTGKKTAKTYPFFKQISEKITYFFPPVSIEEFTFSKRKREMALQELGLSSEDLVIGTVGTINPQKGHKYFIEAAAMVRKRCPHVKFVILGSRLNTQVRYYEKLLFQVKALGLETGRDILFVDPKDGVPLLEQSFDMFWMTSVPKSEGIPTAIEEAMSLGLPVIATDVGSVSEIVDDGMTGFLVPPCNARAIAEKTLLFLENADLRRKMGERARCLAAEYFSVKKCAETHYHTYLEAMGR